MTITTDRKETEIGMIPQEWEVLKLGEISDIVTGCTPSSNNHEYFGDFIPFITPTDFKYFNKYVDKTDRGISELGAEKNKNRIVCKDSIVVTCIGSDMGKVAITKKESLTNQQINTISNIRKQIPDFVYYYMVSIYSHLKSLATGGSTMPIVNKTDFSQIEILLPPLPEQKAIANTLGSLDDKIELLREQNNTLETMGQAIFKSWFVDFEGQEFMVESEMGMIPKGWKVGNLGDVVENFDSKRIPVSNMEREKRRGQYPYYGATSIMDYIDDYIFDGTYVLMGEDGSVMNSQGKPFTQYVRGKIWVNNHAHVLQGKSGFSTELIKIILDNVDIAPYVTGAVQPKISQGNMNSIPVIIPNQESLKKINDNIQPLFEKIKENSDLISNLIEYRDNLLPKLMSGKIRALIK